MIRTIKELLRSDPKLKFILLAGLFIQLVIAYTAVGSYHPDQHFQIIEFSSYQLGEPHGAAAVWEFDHPVRPTIHIYLFSGWHSVMHFLGITNPYTELTILRIVLGLCMFVLFNMIVLYYFKEAEKKVLYSVLLILNFSWFLPYVKVQFSSEIVSSLLFFGTLFWYDLKKDKNPRFAFLLWIGFLFSLAFYFRFQVGFFMAGFGIWLIFFQKKIKHILPMAVGFIAGSLLNTWLDYEFFHRLIITPYQYYYINIIDKRAAMFGTSSFLRYIGLFIAIVSVPPLSIFLFYYAIRAFFKNYRDVLFLTGIVFIIAHCMVGHKEERFVFPVLFILPVWIGWGLPRFFSYYSTSNKAIRYFLKGILVFSVAINFTLLVLLIVTPYSQSIHFTEQLNDRFNKKDEAGNRIYYIRRSPFATPSGSPYIFYQRYFTHTEFIRISSTDTLQLLKANNSYVATTFDDFEGRRVADSLGFHPILYSSNLLWKINGFLQSRKLHPINDIWVLYSHGQ